MGLAVVDFRSPHAPRELERSLHECGFVVLTNHSIDWQMVTGIYAEWDRFFQGDAKHRYPFSPRRQDGYFARPRGGEGTSKGGRVDGRDDKEFYHLFPWGRIPTEVSGDAMAYRSLTMDLGLTILRWLDENAPDHATRRFPMTLQESIEGGQEQTLLRIIRYPPLASSCDPRKTHRSGAHVDTNFITILPSGSAPGLEVCVGGSWVEVPWAPGSLVINTGAMLHMISGGYFPAVEHRVTVPSHAVGQRQRMAMPLFLHPRGDLLLDDTQTAAQFLEARRQSIYSSAT
jgi:isopenicillin N synthase-like dioxygenase